MAVCGSCGKEVKDGAWTCGYCGALMAQSSQPAGGGPSGSGYPPYGEPVPTGQGASAPAGPPSAGLSSTTRLVLIVAGVAVLAILLVWFFVLRGAGGSPFDGTWNEPGGASDSAVVIKGSGNELKVTFKATVNGDKKQYTVPAHVRGDRLEITLDDFAKAAGAEDQIQAAKAQFETFIKNFKLVFTVRDANHLVFAVEGQIVGAAPQQNRSMVLVKAD